MSRLFITSRELDLISDLNKEIVKDVIGQKIYYYHIREDVSNVHDVYEEAPEKMVEVTILKSTTINGKKLVKVKKIIYKGKIRLSNYQ